MKPSKEQIEAWSCAAIARSHLTDNVTALYARIANFAYAAGRKAGMEEAAKMLDHAADNAFTGNMLVWAEKFARDIRAAMEDDK